MKAISIGYHDVVEAITPSDDPLRRCPAHYTLDRPSFQTHLDAILTQAPKAVVSSIGKPRQWVDQVPIFLTFDDGAIGSYTCVAEELESRGWRGHFFVTTDWINKPDFMSPAQIRELHHRGHVIGSHTHSHPARMSNLSWDDLIREWSVSCQILSDILGEPMRVASVADGYYSRKVGQSAAAAGIQVLFNSEPVKSISTVDGCMILGRYSIKAGTPASTTGAIASGALWPSLQQTGLWEAKKAMKALAGDSYLTVRKYILSTRQL